MSASLLRGLQILELLGEEPTGVSELARHLGVDKAGVSRVLQALAREGWVQRSGRRYVLGVRALSLGDGRSERLALSTELAHTLSERSGATAVVVRLAGGAIQPLALESVDAHPDFLAPAAPFDFLAATAAGMALIAQLPDEWADKHLSATPWSTLGGNGPADLAAAHAVLDRIRDGGAASELGWTSPELGCVALPWARWPSMPVAVALLGDLSWVAERESALVEHLRSALESSGAGPSSGAN